MSNVDLVIQLIKDSNKVSGEFKDLPFGNERREFRLEIFKALVKLEASKVGDKDGIISNDE